ncbi:MAG: hypothetical protein OXF89_14730 [Rhodospirillaceae bacterium]|nr:hypothetical protein [Rhodospirillaceae bacterium]
MTDNSRSDSNAVNARRALAVTGAFYILIAFEFLYMASPFAAYFYGVYGLGLDWLQGSRTTSWLIQFFMPHLVEETTSFAIDIHESVGLFLFFGGLAAFAAGAVQIYSAKLRGRGAVTGGLYRHIRHPQYLALIVASIGMLMLWPRYLVVVATVTVIFVYIALARAEESVCLRRFPGYASYLKNTGMFLPAAFSPNFKLPVGDSAAARMAVWALAYAASLGIALLVALGIRAHAIASFHILTEREGVYLSVVAIPQRQLSEVARIARAAPEVRAAISGKTHLIAYVLPTGMYISEIPMHLPPGARYSHRVPADRNPARYKVVFTQAVFGRRAPLPEPSGILWNAVHKTALWEVYVDLGAGQVVASYPPPEKPFYGDRQVPLF